MSFIRGRQRVVTGISPHNANSRYLAPGKRARKPEQEFLMTVGQGGGGEVGYLEGDFGALTPPGNWGRDVLLITISDAGEIVVGYENGWRPVPGPIRLSDSVLAGTVSLAWVNEGPIYGYRSAGNVPRYDAWLAELLGNPITLLFEDLS